MIYYKLDGVLAHKCCAIVGDSLEHTKDDVYTFNRDLDKFLKAENINLQHIHYVSDGSASQNKNRFTVQNLIGRKEEMGMPADWSFFLDIAWQRCSRW